jgi:hypothetical protein
LERPLTAAIELILTLSGHMYGWPIAKGGSLASLDTQRESHGSPMTPPELALCDPFPDLANMVGVSKSEPVLLQATARERS